MFSREDLECLDPGYFEIIYMDDRDVTIMSRNTRHMWYIHNPEYPLMTGSPGTGKTTTASIVAKESNMDKSVHMHTDDFFHWLCHNKWLIFDEK